MYQLVHVNFKPTRTNLTAGRPAIAKGVGCERAYCPIPRYARPLTIAQPGSSARGVGFVLALAVFEPVEVRRVRRARHVLAGHSDEGTGEIGRARRRRF